MASVRRLGGRGLSLLSLLSVLAGLALLGVLTLSSARAQTGTAPPYRVGLRTITIVEHRTMRLHHGHVVPRTLQVYVRFPEDGPGRYPLVVFAHGFDVTPHPYARLLTAIARQGFVVAAPVFPRSSAHAPGGADENDLLGQPGDMSAVITRMILDTRRRGTPFTGLVNGQEVAVAGQSDGGVTALLTAYNLRYRDRRVRAAIVMSAYAPRVGSYDFAPGSPPLLAMQGTADTRNLPKYTYRIFRRAAPPKFLLKLLGAQHLPPYTSEQPQLGIVESTATEFLNVYLRDDQEELPQLMQAGNVRGVTTLEGRG